jgi:CheY-like chemotaxis protein
VKRILVIDDEELTLTLLKSLLEGEGYEVIEARDGESGLNLFRENSADLVITDMVMPVKDGLKTILELREIDANVPVVAISGGGTIAKERYLAVAGYLENVKALAKPFTKKEIVDVVKEVFS